jgi:hypothetical protein
MVSVEMLNWAQSTVFRHHHHSCRAKVSRTVAAQAVSPTLIVALSARMKPSRLSTNLPTTAESPDASRLVSTCQVKVAVSYYRLYLGIICQKSVAGV